jgi:hypothetical protein
MEQHRVSETWPGSEADVRERVLWGGDVSEEAQSELFLRKFTVSSIDKEYKPIISNNLRPKHIHTLLSNIFQLLHIHFRLAIIIFPPMKERITRMMHRSLPGHSSGSKRKGDQ